jgi:hypothetical protein
MEVPLPPRRGRSRCRPRGGGPVVVAVVTVVTITGYLSLLGWDRQKTVGTDGYAHGPYEPWPVIAFVGVLGVLAGWAGWRGRFGLGTAVATVVLTVLWSIDAATAPENDGLWPVGAGMVLIGTAGGFILVSALADHVHTTRRAHRARR